MDVPVKQRHDPPMRLDLTDAELATVATACRAIAYQEGERAKQMANRTLRREWRGRAVRPLLRPSERARLCEP